MTLTIIYNLPKDPILDEEIIEFFTSKGFRVLSSGSGFGERDIEFGREDA